MKSTMGRNANEANLGVSEKNKDLAKSLLDGVLANEFVLYSKTLNYHWNTEGPNFPQFHKLLNDQYEELASMLDEIAESTRQLDRKSVGSLSEFLRLSVLEEEPGVFPDEFSMLRILLADHERVIVELRKGIAKAEAAEELGDVVDLLVGWLEKHQKMAWMLRATLRK